MAISCSLTEQGKKETNKKLSRKTLFCLPSLLRKLATVCTHTQLFLFLKGGDPAAPSGTTTLLRLHPPHEAYLRHGPPCG